MKYKFIEPEINKVEFEFSVPVYDVEVEDNHSYCVGENIIVHNCSTKLETGFTMPMFSCVKECCVSSGVTDNEKDSVAKEVQDELQNYINKNYSLVHDESFRPIPNGPDWIKRLHSVIDGDILNRDVDTQVNSSVDREIERRCNSNKVDIPVIADGGIRHNGDIAKAIVGGATMVMAGSIFAGCIDSPAINVFDKGNMATNSIPDRKRYYGSASEYNKGHKNNIEGFMIEIPCNDLTYEQKLNQIQQSLQSSISYAGGKQLSDLRNVEYRIL